jgi:hypothetical protein
MLRSALIAAASFTFAALLLQIPQTPRANDPTEPIDGREEQSAEMRAALSKWIDVDFEKVPFQQAVRKLSEQAGVSIVLDETSLANAMVDKNSVISLHVKRVRLTSALQLILDPLNLDADFRPDVVVIVDKESMKKTNVAKVYPVADLVIAPGRSQGDLHALLIRITEDLIDRDVWEPNGGDAQMEFFPNTLSMGVSAPLNTQRKVQSFFAMLRTCRSQTIQLLEERDLGKLEEVLVQLAAAPDAPIKLKLPPDYPTPAQIQNAMSEMADAKARADQAVSRVKYLESQVEALRKQVK